MKNKSNTKNLAMCGIFAALAMVFLTVGGLTLLDLSILVLCSMMTMLIMIECGGRMTWIYASATSVLALILLPSKLYALEYIMFSAVYPILKKYFERFRPLPAFLLKIGSLDLTLALAVAVAQYVLLLGDEYFSLNAVTFALGTLFFILYDITITRCVVLYVCKIRKKIFKSQI